MKGVLRAGGLDGGPRFGARGLIALLSDLAANRVPIEGCGLACPCLAWEIASVVVECGFVMALCPRNDVVGLAMTGTFIGMLILLVPGVGIAYKAGIPWGKSRCPAVM